MGVAVHAKISKCFVFNTHARVRDNPTFQEVAVSVESDNDHLLKGHSITQNDFYTLTP